jgi:hypothetical protein
MLLLSSLSPPQLQSSLQAHKLPFPNIFCDFAASSQSVIYLFLVPKKKRKKETEGT